MKNLRLASLLALAACALPAQAGTLSTGMGSDNGLSAPGSGLFLDLTNLTASSQLTVTSFDTYANSNPGTAWSVDVYTRTGSYVGFDGSSAGWTLATSASGTSAGEDALAALTLASGLAVGAGQTLGVYLVATSGGIRYTGGAGVGPTTSFSNADLRLFSDVSRSEPFGGVRFSPRTFAGDVNYDLPAAPTVPGPLAALPFALMSLRRRKRD